MHRRRNSSCLALTTLPPRARLLQDKDGGGDETQFDAFLGNDAGVLGATGGAYDDEDREADNVWDQVEDRMDERRKVRPRVVAVGGEGASMAAWCAALAVLCAMHLPSCCVAFIPIRPWPCKLILVLLLLLLLLLQEQRESKLKEELEKFRSDNPKISEQFADLKRKLADVPMEQVSAGRRRGGGKGPGAHARFPRSRPPHRMSSALRPMCHPLCVCSGSRSPTLVTTQSRSRSTWTASRRCPTPCWRPPRRATAPPRLSTRRAA